MPGISSNNYSDTVILGANVLFKKLLKLKFLSLMLPINQHFIEKKLCERNDSVQTSEWFGLIFETDKKNERAKNCKDSLPANS